MIGWKLSGGGFDHLHREKLQGAAKAFDFAAPSVYFLESQAFFAQIAA